MLRKVLKESGVLTPSQKADLDKFQWEPQELVDMAVNLISTAERRLNKARKIYRAQQEKIETLRQGKLWDAIESTGAKPDYQEEYRAKLDAYYKAVQSR